MKITDIRLMRLRGPLVHGQGGETGGTIGKVVVRVDTDAGVYGLGEADDFMGVRRRHRLHAGVLSRPGPVRGERDRVGVPLGDTAATRRHVSPR